MRFPRLWVCAAILSGVVTSQAATFTVSNTSDAGAGSLRQAIIDANAATTDDTISFNLPRPSQITLTSALPALTGNLRILNEARGDNDLITVARSGAADYRIFNITPGSTVEIAGLVIFGGRVASGDGGGILNNQGTLTVRQSILLGNTAAAGGGLYNLQPAQLTVTQCAFISNNGIALGGALINEAGGPMQLDRCEFSGNTGDGAGVVTAGASTITNCTFNNNTSNPGRAGGLMVLGSSASVTLRNCTFSDNSASAAGGAGGVYLDTGGQVNIGNTIFKRGSAGSNLAIGPGGGLITSAGHSISDDAANGDSGTGPGGFLVGPGDRRNTDPQLGAMASFGGITSSRTPLAGSPAINAGDDAVLGAPLSLTTDQRGLPRRIGAHVDVGAVEVDVVPAGNHVVNTTDEHNDGLCGVGDCTLWEAIDAANAGPNRTVEFGSNVVGTITNRRQPGGLEINANVNIRGPGARLLAVSGENVSRIFKVNPGSGQVGISDLTLRNGFAPGGASGDSGGAIWNRRDELYLFRCILVSNEAVLGGAIYNDGRGGFADLIIDRCTLLLGTALRGGALYNDASTSGSQADVFITLSTLTDNAATATGGAIHNVGKFGGDADIGIRGATFSANSAPAGGGSIYSERDFGTAIVSLTNTILSVGPSGTTLVYHASGGTGFIFSNGGNLSSDAAGGDGSTGPGGFLNHSGDIRNTDPQLAPLSNNGGPTDTRALLPGSPAINAAIDSADPTDQRGYGRNGPSDIGAFEFKGILPVTLANISTRLRVETGDNVLIAGFILTGSEDKKVIIRALGPSLGLPGQLANPILELYQGSTFLAGNNDWQSQPVADRQAVIDSTIPPSNDLESALVRTLPANGTAYTAIVRGASNGTGIAVVEVYDLDRSVDSKLANISTRGLVQTGDNVLIAGIIVAGTVPSQKVIIRAIGPSLPIAGRLEDPTLELRDRNGALLRANDNWRDNNPQEIIDTTIPPTNDFESAIVGTLGLGNYTAIVRGVSNTTGIGIVEVYALP